MMTTPPQGASRLHPGWHFSSILLLPVLVACLAVAGSGVHQYFRRICAIKLPPRPANAFPHTSHNGNKLFEHSAEPQGTVQTVYHVTKEFGPASMGGLGTMLTALVSAQVQSPRSPRPVVIMPHYSYLDTVANLTDERQARVSITTFYRLAISYRPRIVFGWLGPRKLRTVSVQVSKLVWTVGFESAAGYSDVLEPVPLHPLGPGHNNTEATLDAVQSRDRRNITVFLIGRGSTHPFETAFTADGPHDIYSAPPPLPQEWKDLYFAKSVAALVLELEKDADALGRSVVHLHGATNSMVACFLRDPSQLDIEGLARRRSASVPVVYTLHDYLDEVEYSNLYRNLRTFADPDHCSKIVRSGYEPPSWLQSYLHPSPTSACGRYFPSSLAITLSDVATFVSATMASLLPAPAHFPFPSNSRVVPALQAKDAEGTWVGITNGLDFGDKDDGRNPFLSNQLGAIGATFPPAGSEAPRGFWAAKQMAKAWLVQHHPDILPPRAAGGPLILFIGRFQYDKGCELFTDLLTVLASPRFLSSGAHFIALGTRNNYPHASIRSLANSHPTIFTLIDDPALQPSLGPILRMAADFVFVPSFAESFGLVAAEGLLFGSRAISTGVGGLREFLVDGEGGNAVLFELEREEPGRGGRGGVTERTRASCRGAVERALRAWEERKGEGVEEQEGFARRMVAYTDAMRWDRRDGPVEKYTRVYEKAAELARGRDEG